MNEVGRYAKRPMVVEAVRWPCDAAVLNEWIGPEADFTVKGWDDTTWHRPAPEGDPDSILVWNGPDQCWKEIRDGAWIVKGPADGDFYPCADAIFAGTFYVVTEED